jgi:ABC-type antimicrobial peptide transport system permease subunit
VHAPIFRRASAGGREILHGIDLRVPSGKVHVVMGPNGSGKSTLSHVLMGRGIQQQDTSNSPGVAVVNGSFVKEFFKPGTNPLGQHFGSDGATSPGDYEIVGVVEDTAYSSIYWKNHSMYFVPMMQRPKSFNSPIENDISLYAGTIVIQTDRPMPQMEQLARNTLSFINPNLAIVKFQTFEQQIPDQFTSERMIARLTLAFGGLALLLAMIGLYGVTAYTVARRTPEIGIRMAVGAERGNIIAMVMRGAFFQIVVGLLVGIPIALVCVRFVKAQLYEIRSASPIIVFGAILTLTLAAIVAGLIPARRAVSIEPAEALRTE